MSATSFLVDLRRSLVIADPQHFPMNMEKTSREDYPVDSYPIMAYDASNVLATPFGYKSFFDETTKLNIGLLPTLLVQQIFTYQTSALDAIQFALCEDGIYVAFATEPTPANWAKIIDTSTGMVVGGRRLWTVAVIANYVYLYQAGQPKFWAIVDPAKYAEAATPSLIAGATRTQVWTNWGAGIISYVPSFLNMTGQLGLFRADNRLGFWDSDNSVGWSSSVAIEDFKPDAKTFAGSTKFADVQGRIIKILGSGDNFIIYSTRSIVRCVGLDNSPEKWRGEAIMSEVGVSFDTQVVAAQPDQIHYCITQAGICAITEGNPEYIATEVMDYIAETFPLYSLFLIEGRYLFISVNGTFPGSEYGTESVIINDWANNNFIFPRPTYPALEDGKDYIEDYISGRENQVQQALKDYSPIVDVSTIPEGQLLSPCFDVKGFESTWAETTFSPYNINNEFFYSKLGAYSFDYVGPVYVEPVVTNNSIIVNDVAPGDFAGELFAANLNLGMAAFNRQVAYQKAIELANTDFTVQVDRDDIYVDPESTTTVEWPKELIRSCILFDAVNIEELKVAGNECRLQLKVPTKGNLRLNTYFEGTESAGSRILYTSMHPGVLPAVALAAGFPQISAPYATPIGCKMFVTRDQLREGTQAFLAAGGPLNDSSPTEPNERYMFAKSWFCSWLYSNYPSQVTAVGLYGLAVLLEAGKPIINCPTFSPGYRGQFEVLSINGAKWYHNIDGMPITVKPPTDEQPNPCNIHQYYIGPWDIGDDDPVYWPAFGTWLSSGLSVWEFLALVGYDAAENNLCRLQGTLKHEIEYEPLVTEDQIVWEMELSGWGYYPPSGGSFRKTHNRNSGRPTCPMPGRAVTITPPVLDVNKLPPLDRPEVNNPPYNWEYPSTIPLPDNYALFQKGSLAPYYPVYGAAAVYDLLLQKWGTYNNSHKLVQELMPVNRIDSSIMPVADKGMFAGAMTPTGACTVFKDKNPMSRITYGKMAFYRRGMSLATGAIAHFGALASGTLIVEASMDGVTIDPLLSYAVPFVNQRNVTLPFTTRAKWFNIRVEGNFNLTYLELLAEPRGRR